MNYTIISTSGWQGDDWKVRKTTNDKVEAKQFAESIRTADAKQDGYHVRIKSHRKEISELTSWDGGFGVVTFSDGTQALDVEMYERWQVETSA